MIQINAAARLSNTAVQLEAAQKVLAATAADAGKIVLWIQKATGAEGVAKGKAGKKESMTFKIKAGKDVLTLGIELDVAAGGVLNLSGESKLLGDFGTVSDKTGRKVIIAFKNELRAILADDESENAPETIKLLKKLISAKSKVEA